MLCVAAGKAKNKRFQSSSHDQRPFKGPLFGIERTMRRRMRELSPSSFWFVITTPWGVSIGEADRLKRFKLRLRLAFSVPTLGV
jgi:hypothetical protein